MEPHTVRPVIWSLKNIKDAKIMLNLRYDDAQCTIESIQKLIDALISEYGNDREQIQRVIIAHFKKRKC